ncbi:unnamed protein product [Mytilus coruscus]|uniref:Uncharacterized protein n=1 Tax=Mytilus coruscus TaxID=42192 RepID=A0A6J8F430_MYTCO|nr:unnamed protein product [Mytilus coruscus]
MKDKKTKEKEYSMNLYPLRIYLKPGRISPNTELIMYEQILIIALIVFLFSGKTNTHIKVKCPSGKQLYLRAKSVCLSVEKYTCLLDYVNNINKENCNGPKTKPPGDKTVVNSGNFDTESCLLGRFQPFSFSTSQGNNCIYKKTTCIEEGQLIYSNGTSVYDRKCRCDYTKNFSFVSIKRLDMCSCDPTTEDCSCYTKLCSIGQILTPGILCMFLIPLIHEIIEIFNTDGTIEIYDSPENTTYTAHTEEEQAIQKLFEEYKSDYIIRRKEVEQ